MGRLEDIAKRNKKSLAILDVVGTGISAGTGQSMSPADEPRIPSQKFSNYLGAGLVIAFLVIVVLVVVF